jgi:predicted nuclease of predicted toxin-antitoxin system
MKLLLDANMPRSTQAALAQRGFDAVAVRDILPPATPDSVIYDLAKQEGRLLITRDHDFLNILLYPPAQTPGIIVVKTQRLTAKAINALLLDFLGRVTEPQIQNALVVLEPHRYRILR